MAARVALQLDLAKRSVFVQWETALFECRAPDAARVALGFDRAGRSSKLPSECDVKRDDVRADRLYLDLMLEEVEFVGACAFCDLSSGSWGWCLHCERIYPPPNGETTNGSVWTPTATADQRMFFLFHPLRGVKTVSRRLIISPRT